MQSLLSLLGFSKDQPKEKIVTCHFCTTCNHPDFASEKVKDIEDLGTTSGSKMYKLLCEQIESQWVLEAKHCISMTLQDAGMDHKQEAKIYKSQKYPFVKLKLIPTRCLSACSFAHVFALNCTNQSFSYQFGGINPSHLNDLIEMIDLYCSSEDGYSSTRTRPKSLKGYVLARIPPSNGRGT
jgi:predicted metal-binding protein